MSEVDPKVYDRIILIVLGIPVLFLLIFTVVSVLQLRDINSKIEEGQSQAVTKTLSRINSREELSETHQQFLILAVLEEESLSERYRQGHYSLVSRSFKQFLGFFTGIIMIIVGCVFVLLKLREEINTSGSQGDTWKFALVTNSPGVVFGIIGAVLIAVTSTTNDKISVRDSGLYLSREFLVAPFLLQKGSEQTLHDYMKSQEVTDSGGIGDTLFVKYPPTSKNNKKKKEERNSDTGIIIQRPPQIQRDNEKDN